MTNLSFLKKFKNYFSILLGGIILSTGVTLFLVPNHIVAGGTPGVAILINYFTKYPLGMIMFFINIPMILLSIKFINKGYAFRTIFSICVTSFSVDFIRLTLGLEGFVINPILASVFAGILVGFGLGFIIEGNASAGGPSVIARLISQKTKFKEFKIVILLDALIVILAGIVFQNIETTLLSLVTVYVSLKSLDMILSGRFVFKMVHISTKNAQSLSKHIFDSLNIEGTVVSALELDMKTNKQIIMVVIESSKIVELKYLIEKYDSESFLVINDASEILGRGH